MKLTDEVTIWLTGGEDSFRSKAEVKYKSYEVITATGATHAVDELTMLIPAGKVTEDQIATVEWRGKSYYPLGVAKVFRRRGRDHHYQIRLSN